LRKSLYGFIVVALVVMTGAWACNVSTANISSLKTGKDKGITQAATTFKAGDTIYANAAVGNNPGKVAVKMYITVEDAPGMTKGSTIPNSEVKLDLDGDGTAKYNFPTFATSKGGKFNIVAEMMNDAGEKKDSKTVAVVVEPGTAAAADDRSADKSGDKDEDKDDK
jgi:hypothetical protein